MIKKCLGLLALVATLAACNQPATSDDATNAGSNSAAFNLDAAKSFIDSANLRFADAVRRGDSAALSGFYHSDAQFLLPNHEPIGKANIEETMGGMLRMGIKDTKLTTADLVGNDELLVETGNYEMYGENKMVLDKGKYLVAWKKENGEWKMYRDIINTNMPMSQGH